MHWTLKFQLFLFDFDGLLVNTEELHFAAYREMCRARGFSLEWDLGQFFTSAHTEATSLRRDIYAQFPELYAQEPRWEVLYAEKKEAYQRLLKEGELQLMPGVAEVLKKVEKEGSRRCVVTNSTKPQVDLIRSKLAPLQSIPLWITREDYHEPKPNPEGYQKALNMLGKPNDRVIGFEDSVKGLKALQGAGIKDAILICPPYHSQLKELSPQTKYFPSFFDVSFE